MTNIERGEAGRPLPRASRDALVLAGLYVVLAGAWIGLSDRVVTALFAGDAAAMAAAQAIKGFAFVAITAALLFVAARRGFKRRDFLHKRLAASEATYRTLIEGQADPLLIIDADLSVLYGNAAGLACFDGRTGRLTDLFPAGMVDLVRRRLSALGPLARVARVDLPLRSDGRWFAWTATAVFDDDQALLHYQISGHDVSDRLRSQEDLRATRDCLETAIAARTRELEESNQRLRDFAEVSSDWLWEIDAGGRVTFLSESFPWAEPDGSRAFLGRSILDVPPLRREDGTAEEYERMMAFAAGRQPFRDIERAVTGADGRRRHYRIKAKPLFDAAGTLLGWRGAGIDVTERKCAELALIEAHEALEQRVRERTLALQQEVGERQRAENALASDRALLRCLLDSIPDLIFVKDADSVYLGGNKAFCTFVGRAEDEFVGLSDLDLFPPEIGAFFREQDRQMLAEGVARTNEEWVDYPDGRRVLFDTLKTPYFGPGNELLGVVGISRDITARKLAEDGLRASEERFRQLVEDVDVVAWEWDVATQCFVYVSPQGLRLTGFTAEQWYAPGFWLDRIHPADRAEVTRIARLVVEGHANLNVEYRMLRPDGAVLWLRDIFHVHSELGRAHTLRGLMIDITDRKQAEAQLIQASKLATLGEMAAGMAHELNQPLNIIRMAADGRLMDIADGIDDRPAVERSFTTIAGQCQRMADIVAHTRVFSRAEDDHAVVFDAWAAVDSVVAMVRQQFGTEGIAVAWKRPATPAPVRGAPLRLEQVVLNLLTNARDGVRATEAPRDIAVAGRIDAGLLRLTVADSGPGIDPAQLQRVFEPFYTTKGPGEGTGLGLSISMHIVNRMSGTIEAANGDAHGGTGGACLTVTLPLAAEDPASPPAAPEAGPADTAARPAHLLVVDDEPLAVRHMAELLRRGGYRVSTAADGDEALALFRREPADLVITDARMPRRDGAGLIAGLHDIEPLLPVIVVSGQHDVDQLIATGRRRGEAARILPKPVDIALLRQTVAELLDS